jgi:hypothetical protein
MGRKRKVSKDDPYSRFLKLDEAWRNDMLSRDSAYIHAELGRVAMNDIQLALAKKADMDLKQKQEIVKQASEQYTEGHKRNMLTIEFFTEVLRSKGEDVPSFEDFYKEVANGEIVEGE